MLVRIPVGPRPSLHRLRRGSLRLVRRLHSYYGGSDFSRSCIIGYGSSPSRCGPWGRRVHRPNVRPPRFRRLPFVRDVFFDHGRASVPRIPGPHMLPSPWLTGPASAILWLSRLNSTPHTIAVYASHPPSPATTQHSLPGARYGLPGPVSHRQDHASFPGAQAIHSLRGEMDCFAALAMTWNSTHTFTPRGASADMVLSKLGRADL